MIFGGLAHSVSASHISGVNISYEHVVDDSYLITVNLFRDCDELQALPANLSVFITSSCSILGYQLFPQIDLTDVSQLCPDQMINSSCNGGFQPGIQLGVYQKMVNLPPCIDWRIVVSEQNRDQAIVNLLNPELYTVYVDAVLNNAAGLQNNSPVLSLLNLPYVCVNDPLFYNLGFLDIEGDSLVYSLIPAQAAELANSPFELTYTGTYTGAEPITDMTIDPHTGQMEVTPTSLGKYNCVVHVSEYRNGVLIGSVSYDFLFLVTLCGVPPPEPNLSSLSHVSGGGYPLDQNTIGICAGDDFCFSMEFFSPESGSSLFLSSNISTIIPGATETISGSNPATITLCGSLPPNFEESAFVITAIDDVCPIYGQAFYSIDLSFRQPIEALASSNSCLGDELAISANNDTLYTWSSADGNILSPGVDITCNPCQIANVYPDSSTAYVVTGAYANSSCAHTDTVFVEVPLTLAAIVTNESCEGGDGFIDVTVLSGSGSYSIQWDDSPTAELFRASLGAASYTLHVLDEVFGCNRTATYTVSAIPSPMANAGSDTVVCGLTSHLVATPSFGDKLWSASGSAIFANAVEETTQVTVDSQGTYLFVFTEDAGLGCISSDTVEVTFLEQPEVTISAPDSVCGLELALSGNVVNGNWVWTTVSGVEISEPLSLNTLAVSDQYGHSMVTLNAENGLCLDADTLNIYFIEQPQATAVGDSGICGSTTLIEGSAGVGAGLWELSPNLSTIELLSEQAIQITANNFGDAYAIWQRSNEDFCFDRDTLSILFTNQPFVDLGPDTSICGSSLQLTNNLPVGNLTWQLSPTLDGIDSFEDNQLVSGSYGSQSLILSADNGYGCTASDTVEVHFVEQPILLPIAADTACGLSIAVNAQNLGETSYWQIPAELQVSNSLSALVTLSAYDQGSHEALWIVDNAGLCRDTAVYLLTFYGQPVAHAGPDQQLCGLTTNLEAIGSFGDLMWQGPDPLEFSEVSSANTTVSSQWFGSFHAVLTETNGICSSSDSILIQFVSAPEIQNVNLECTGTDATFILSFDIALGDTASYQLEGVTGELDNFNFQSAPLPSDTQIMAILSDDGFCGSDTLVSTKFCPVTTDAGHMSLDTLNICVNEPAESLPASAFHKDGNDALLYALHTSPNSTLGEVMAWNEVPIFSFEASLEYNSVYFISAVVGNAQNDGIDLDDPQLSVSTGTPVIFRELPYGEIGGELVACPNEEIFIPVTVQGPLPQYLSYSLHELDILDTIVTGDFEIFASDSGRYTLLYTATAYCIGNVAGHFDLDYFALPQAEMFGETSTCAGDPVEISVQLVGAAPFDFAFDRNDSLIAAFSGIQTAYEFEVELEGIYAVAPLSDANCTLPYAAFFNLEVRPLPIADAGVDRDLCSGDSTMLGASYLTGQNYMWDENDALLDIDVAQPIFTAENNTPFAQLHLLHVSVEKNDCFVNDLVQIAVQPLPEAQLAGATNVCSGDSLFLMGFGADSIRWSPESYFTSPTTAEAYFIGQSDQWISVTAISPYGCTDSESLLITVLPTPNAAFEVSDFAICAPTLLEAYALDQDENNLYNWDIDGFTFDKSASTSYMFEEMGKHTLSLKVLSPEGCTHTYSWPDTIQIFDAYADFFYWPEHPNISNPEVSFTGSMPLGAAAVWTIDSLAMGWSLAPTYLFPTDSGGAYEVCLHVISLEGCFADHCEVVWVKDDFYIYVPNAFTPDGDGLNDLFYPEMQRLDLAFYHFWIENRKGQVVFETRDMSQKWDGTTETTEYFGSNEIYTWFVVAQPDFNLAAQTFSGHVMVLR